MWNSRFAHSRLRTALAGAIALAALFAPVLAADRQAPRAVIVTGHDGPFHDWQKTTDALNDVLSADNAFQVTVVKDPEFLADAKLHDYRLVVLNYCNWQRPGISQAARENFQKYLSQGGGLAIVHFANGAFHEKLPGSNGEGWPEFDKICKRRWVWGESAHDNLGRFEVEIASEPHPATKGLPAFETEDELYFKQRGDEPITVLATARSKVTGRDEPQAFVYTYGKGRVFQTTLGHSAAAIRNAGAAALIRRGCLWAAKDLAKDEN